MGVYSSCAYIHCKKAVVLILSIESNIFDFDINGLFLRRFENSTVSFLCPLSAQDNADNTDNRKDTKLPCFPEFVDFSVNYWLLMLYRKTRNLFPADFKSLASIMRSG